MGYANEQFPFLATVSKPSVNIRAGGNTNFERLAQLEKGDEIIVLGKVYDWYKIQLPATAKAYVRADYLKIGENPTTAELIGDNVNVRAAANSNSSSLAVLKKGDIVRTITLTNGWWQIQAPTQAVGWVRQDFLTFKSSNLKEAKPKAISKSLQTLEVKGKLVSLSSPQGQIRYELLINDKPAYYVQSVPDIDRFKGAFVSINGLILSDQNHPSYPVLHTINISLLL